MLTATLSPKLKQLLEGYPARLILPVQWGEMDTFNHVNNVVYARYFESSRVHYLTMIGERMKSKDPYGFMRPQGIGPIVKSTLVNFRFPVVFPDTLAIGCRVEWIKRTQLLMTYKAFSLKHEKLAADGEAVVVSYDYDSGKKADFPEDILRIIREIESKELPLLD
jgi:acyl-CoA thioester hydrolase